jgi:hypothetical protein
MPFNPNNVVDCQVFAGRKRTVEVTFKDGTSQIFDYSEVTDEVWAFAATTLMKIFKPDLRRSILNN